MRTADFDYVLPPELIAQQPAPQRDQSRLLVLHRENDEIEHRQFSDLSQYLHPGDVLVLNNSRVIPARLRGTNSKTGGQFEILLLEENSTNDWWAMMKPGKRARIGTQIHITHHASRTTSPISAIVIETNDEGHRRLRFDGVPDVLNVLNELGEVPLPPYICRPFVTLSPAAGGGEGRGEGARNATSADDKERYQTVYADAAGSVAAPTAGLHFTGNTLDQIRSRGVNVCFVTLHVGLGTFAPVKTDKLENHVMHEERYEVSEATARVVNEAKANGRRVIAVGTTTVRVLESIAAQNGGRVVAGSERTRIFIHPPHDFKIVDALLTNFHLPRSTLLMLVSAFAAPGKTSGQEAILSAYAEAVRERYRFFSYGDAMLIL